MWGLTEMEPKSQKMVGEGFVCNQFADIGEGKTGPPLDAFVECARMDKPKAVTAAAHKLARLIYMMLTKGEEYTDQGQNYYEDRYRERVPLAIIYRIDLNPINAQK
jgi:hypothetical protein